MMTCVGLRAMEKCAQVALAQMTTRVGMGATCCPSPDGDTCRAGREPRVQKHNGMEREETQL